MSDLPKKSIRITDLTRLDTSAKVDAKQELLFPVACNQTEKDTFSMPLNTLVTWLLLKHAADRDLSNLTDIGQAILDAKQDYFNKVAVNTDLNTFTRDGIWKVELNGTVECHAPGSGVGYYVVSVDTDEDGLIEQQARNLNMSSGDIYHRQRINGTWTGWGLITQDMGAPTFTEAPTVVNPGTNDDQLATIGQLNVKFSDIFQTEWRITEGVLVKGEVTYSGGVLTLPGRSKYYTNDSMKVENPTALTINIPSNVKRYVFADGNGNLRAWETFLKVVETPTIIPADTLIYNIYSDEYVDANGSYGLCPLGIVDNGSFAQSAGIQFLNVDNLKATLDALHVPLKVDKQIGNNYQNSVVASDTEYERQMSAGHYVDDGEGGFDLEFGAGVTVTSHQEDENNPDTYNKDVEATVFAQDGSSRTEIKLTPQGATLNSDDTDNVDELIATKKDIRELETRALTFRGYVGTTAPSSSTYQLQEGNLWINASAMPTSFPVAAVSIKRWNGSSWVNYGSTYSALNFDAWRNLVDGEGYYWFAGEWVVMSTDLSTDHFILGQDGKWRIKSSVQLPGSPTAEQDARTNAGLVRKGQMDTALSAKANDSAALHKAGTETATGNKTFSGTFTASGSSLTGNTNAFNIHTKDGKVGVAADQGSVVGKLLITADTIAVASSASGTDTIINCGVSYT